MYNLLNSPNGPLGQAGMSNASTRPQGIFSNAPATFNNFGRGIDTFTNSIGDKAHALFGKLFGGMFPGADGAFGGQGPMTPQNPTPTGGAPSLFGEPGQPGNQGTPTQSNPIAMATAQGTNPVSNVVPNANGNNVNPLTQSGMDGGGILSKFMQSQGQ